MDEKSSRKKLLYILIGLIGIVLFSAVGCLIFIQTLATAFGGIDGLFGNSCPPDTPESIEDIAQFTLPPSAENLWSLCVSMQGWSAEARFDMSPDDLDVFISSVWLETTLNNSGVPRYISFFEEGLMFEDMTSYLYSLETSGTDLLQEILIDTSNPRLYTVYMEVLGG